MSNLCSEILQVSEASTYNDDLSYSHVGKDISCNLGSLNIAKTMDSPDFSKTIEMANVEMPFGQLLVYTFEPGQSLPIKKEVLSVEIEAVNA